jgi:hypothetical protein
LGDPSTDPGIPAASLAPPGGGAPRRVADRSAG